MDKIENYSTSELLYELLVRIDGDKEAFAACLRGHGVDDIAKFRKALTSCYQPESLVYDVNNYEGSTIERNILDNIDKYNSCRSLILSSPTILFSYKKEDALRSISIYDAKKLLSSVTFNKAKGVQENALVARLPYHRATDGTRIRDAINFYEEQVLRQAGETTCLRQNLFVLNRETKRDIVLEHYGEIADYFIDGPDEYIWGGFGKSAKLKLHYSKKGKKFENLRIRDNFIRMIADYTTLTELEKGPIKSKALERFIKK